MEKFREANIRGQSKVCRMKPILLILGTIAFISLLAGGLWNIFREQEPVMGAIQLGISGALFIVLIYFGFVRR